MTSTVSSNEKIIKKEKNSFLSLLLWTLKSHKFIFILYFCAMIMIMFLGTLFVENSMRFETTEQFYYILNSGITEVLSGLIPFISIVFTIIIGTNIFKIYHNKRMMDMYGSLPIKKITMFLSRYLAGALVIIVTLLVGGLLCGITPVFMLSRINYFDTSFFTLVMKNILLITMSSIASFSMFALISMICGSSLYTIVMFIAINIIYPIMVSIIVDDVSSVIPGFKFLLYNIQVPFMAFMILSPILSTFMNIDYYGQYTVLDGDVYSNFKFNISSYVIYWILFIIVFLIASILISRIRKNENVQSVFIFSFIKYIFMVPLTICLGYIAGTVIKSILHFINEQDMGLYFVLGSIIGIAVAYVVLFIIFNKGVKGIVKTLPVLGISLCIFFAYYIFIATGLFGVDMYVPNENDVVSVSLSWDSFTGDKAEKLKEMGKDRYVIKYDDWYIDSNTKEIKVLDEYINDKDFIKDAIEIHKIIADDLHNVNGALYSFDRHNDYYFSKDISYRYEPFVVSYKLKDGSVVNRYYLPGDFDYNKIADLYKKLLGSKEIKCASTLLLHISIDDITGFSIISDDSSYSQDFTLNLDDRRYKVTNKEFLGKLIPTLKKEIEQDNHFYNPLDDEYQVHVNYDNNKTTTNIPSIGSYNGYSDEELLHYGIIEEYITIPKENYPETWKIIEEYSNSSKLFLNEIETEEE